MTFASSSPAFANPRVMGIAIVILIALRAVMAAWLPLSADEAYYLMWSHHLAKGYYDHPPAIAFLIRCGTILFGETPLGVRASGIVLSIPASWFVWQAAKLVLHDECKAALAAIYFNLTLMVGVEMLAATPDQPSIVTIAGYIWCLCKLQKTQDGRYWLAAGVAAGLSLLSKYSMFIVSLGTLVWLLVGPWPWPRTNGSKRTKWLFTPWPYLGGGLALLIFSPNLLWQSQHHWMTFAFQFGRIGRGGYTLRYLAEFAGAQLGLATPLILILAGIGLWRSRVPGNERFVLVAIIVTALLFFVFHALRDRVQGNWPCFIYPALAIMAADGVSSAPRWLVRAAGPLAAFLLLTVYAQAAFSLFPLKNDPSARLLARAFPQAAQILASEAQAGLAGAVITTDYETTALLHYYQPRLKVIQVGDTYRYPDSPGAPSDLLKGRLLYFVEDRREQTGTVRHFFRDIGAVNQITPRAGGTYYEILPLQNPRQLSFGKIP
jgi:4-amino-4-deoxy-L-arabinose transferase-like glycosyltransferase